VLVCLLVSGSAIGYALHVQRQAEESRQAFTIQSADARTEAAPAGGEVARLRQMLEEKETAYIQLHDELENLKRQSSEGAPASNASSRDFTNTATSVRSGESYMDRLKREDPDQYKKIQDQQLQRRQQAEARYQDAMARLQQRRQAAASPEEAALLDQLTASLTKLRQIGEGWEQVRSLPDSQRAEQMQKLAQESMTAYQNYSDLRSKDRQLQLSLLAAQVGYRDPQQAAQFTSAIQKIYDETDSSLSRFFGTGRRRGGGSGSSQ